MTNAITGFVFDLDGVITDTAKYHFQAWQEIAKSELGISITPEVNELLKGKSRLDSLNEILNFGQQIGVHSATELSKIATKKNKRYQELIADMTDVDILPGVTEFLHELSNAHYRMAVASASFNAPRIIQQLGLTAYLNKIVDPSSVQNGKPAPDLFMAAADLIHSEYATTIGVEDAIAGITGIKAAGMFAIGIGSVKVLPTADMVIEASSQLNLQSIQHAFAHRDYSI